MFENFQEYIVENLEIQFGSFSLYQELYQIGEVDVGVKLGKNMYKIRNYFKGF